MKKILLSISILFTLIFTSCYHTVLYNIREDVKPEDALVSGTIDTISRYTVNGKEYLVLIAQANKNDTSGLFAENTASAQIFYKPADSNQHGEWKIYKNLPFKETHHYDYYGKADHVGEQLILTHADSEYLYAVTAEYKNDENEGTSNPSKYHLYATKVSLNADGTWNTDNTWTDIIDDGSNINYLPIYKYDSWYYNAFSIFSTNAIQSAHRKVFIRCGNPLAPLSDYQTVTYYQLNGTSSPSAVSLKPVDSSNLNRINSAVYFNNSIMCFNSIASITNETATSDATMVYYGTDSNIYYKSITDTEFTKCGFKTVSPVSTLSVCKDALLIGRANYGSSSMTANGGIAKTSLDSNGIPGTDLESFTTNAEVQLSSSYFILALLNTDPTQTEIDSTFYATTAFFGSGTSSAVNYDNIGLWSYYPVRKNWNRE